MGAFDFRSFLDSLDSRGELFRVPVEIDTLDEIGAFIARADYEGVESSILFENPKGFDIPVLANTVGHTYRRIAEAFGVAQDNALPDCAMKMMQVLKSGGVSPQRVDQDKALCQQVVLEGDEVDLSLLPALRLQPSGRPGRVGCRGRALHDQPLCFQTQGKCP